MVESEGDSDVIRDTYERAVANIPESPNKNDWRRYIYLWVSFNDFYLTVN
jgi:crooked neck